MLGFIVHNYISVYNDITFGRFWFPFVRSGYNMMTLHWYCVIYMGIPMCGVHCDFHVNTMLCSILLPFVLMYVHVLMMLFIFIFRVLTHS